jgi:hypothetical protein
VKAYEGKSEDDAKLCFLNVVKVRKFAQEIVESEVKSFRDCLKGTKVSEEVCFENFKKSLETTQKSAVALKYKEMTQTAQGGP